MKALLLDLGIGDDRVVSTEQTGLSSLQVNDAGGENEFHLGLQEPTLQSLKINSQSGQDQLQLNGHGTILWMTEGQVETSFSRIEHEGIAQLVLGNLESKTEFAARPEIKIDTSEFSEDKLLLVGTADSDAIEIYAENDQFITQTFSAGNATRQQTYSRNDINKVDMFLLGGDDVVRVSGQSIDAMSPLELEIQGDRDNDWISVQALPVKVTDVHGNNVITTGPGDDEIHTGFGDDEIDTGDGVNLIHDMGGVNRIVTGHHDDSIYHSNENDWIYASDGVNQIWLNGELQNWHNKKFAADVNRDEVVTPLDALLVINRLNQIGSHALQGSADSVSYYYDTDGDNYLSPIDALIVINFLNRPIAEGEPEFAAEIAAKPTTDRSLATDACFAKWGESVDAAEIAAALPLDRQDHSTRERLSSLASLFIFDDRSSNPSKKRSSSP